MEQPNAAITEPVATEVAQVEPLEIVTYCPRCRCLEGSFPAQVVCTECGTELKPVPDGERRPSRELRTWGNRHMTKVGRALKSVFTGKASKGSTIRIGNKVGTTRPYLRDSLLKDNMTHEDVVITPSGCVYVQQFNRDGKPSGLKRIKGKEAIALAESIVAKIAAQKAAAETVETAAAA